MKNDVKHSSTKEIAEAIYVVNRHAKTAPDPRHLYTLKKKAIQQLIAQKHAKKIGLHYSDHPKYSHQHSTLLVQVANYYFHIPPRKEDFQALKHLGNIDQSYRNPKPSLSLSKAKKVLYRYLNWEEDSKITAEQRNKRHTKSPYNNPHYAPWGQLVSWEQKDRRR
ncbi:YkyB family protein [Pontibacillus sp. ALD_SL1]|uniref:YkyB family protein n=1 Tax=Pontibacillus sp. ALD_SL1 TaxID=2777185 RepID=UPI001F61232A|nr:YkyB family protein [Pontibacillus sp. ALD_SL1]